MHEGPDRAPFGVLLVEVLNDVEFTLLFIFELLHVLQDIADISEEVVTFSKDLPQLLQVNLYIGI
ncbi:MAG: hypothetical protein OCC45_01210 [Desulfotalea sp.]